MRVAVRYRAAGELNEVGGDFYDVFETIDARFAVAVGDVCGKGAKAAAITSLARHTLRAAAMHERLPSEALLMLNEALRRQELDTDFCTVAYAQLRPTPSGEVALLLANGGHPPPLLLRATGDVGPVGRPGTLLGVVPDPRLSDTALTLAPGDSLVLYTDGVTEARTSDGMFGSERLEELVRSCAGMRAAAIADVIERTVMDEQNGEARDDIAVLVLRAAPTA
jgi:sigma-B regulation protein RsbU (phosphoserine phosphatase)